jgi:hypothetical protein
MIAIAADVARASAPLELIEEGPDRCGREVRCAVSTRELTEVNGIAAGAALIGDARAGVDCGGRGLALVPGHEQVQGVFTVGERHDGVIVTVRHPNGDGMIGGFVAAAVGMVGVGDCSRHGRDGAKDVGEFTADRVGHHAAVAESGREDALIVDTELASEQREQGLDQGDVATARIGETRVDSFGRDEDGLAPGTLFEAVVRPAPGVAGGDVIRFAALPMEGLLAL